MPGSFGSTNATTCTPGGYRSTTARMSAALRPSPTSQTLSDFRFWPSYSYVNSTSAQYDVVVLPDSVFCGRPSDRAGDDGRRDADRRVIQPGLVVHRAQSHVHEEPTDPHNWQADQQYKHQQAASVGAEQRLLDLQLAIGVDPVSHVAPYSLGSRAPNTKGKISIHVCSSTWSTNPWARDRKGF